MDEGDFQEMIDGIDELADWMNGEGTADVTHVDDETFERTVYKNVTFDEAMKIQDGSDDE